MTKLFQSKFLKVHFISVSTLFHQTCCLEINLKTIDDEENNVSRYHYDKLPLEDDQKSEHATDRLSVIPETYFDMTGDSIHNYDFDVMIENFTKPLKKYDMVYIHSKIFYMVKQEKILFF